MCNSSSRKFRVDSSRRQLVSINAVCPPDLSGGVHDAPSSLRRTGKQRPDGEWVAPFCASNESIHRRRSVGTGFPLYVYGFWQERPLDGGFGS